jgi:hypothetical protein
MDVLALLRSKNRCLAKFLEMSGDYLEDTGRAADLSDLPALQQRRDSVLKAIELYDRKIEEVAACLTDESRTPELTAAVRNELARKDALVEAILKIDLALISLIEEAKNGLLQQLASERKSAQAIRKFKSTWVSNSGEGIDEKL